MANQAFSTRCFRSLIAGSTEVLVFRPLVPGLRGSGILGFCPLSSGLWHSGVLLSGKPPYSFSAVRPLTCGKNQITPNVKSGVNESANRVVWMEVMSAIFPTKGEKAPPSP